MKTTSRRLDVRMCSGCLEKMREIDSIKRKLDKKSKRIASLEKKLGERLRSPADNNYSERGLRPLVIARKLSFGTQSARGSRTRTVLMSVLHSLKKQGCDPIARLQVAMKLKAANPGTDLADFIFPEISGKPSLRSPPVQTARDCAPKAWANVHGPCPTAVAVTG